MLLHSVAALFSFLFAGHRRLPVPPHDERVFNCVWQAAFDSGTEAPPQKVAADLNLPWTEREAAEWAQHCKPCASCGAWMYDSLTDHCHRCRDW